MHFDFFFLMQYFQTPANFNKVLWRRHTIIVPPYADPESRDTPVSNSNSRLESANTNVPPLYSESISSPTSGTRGVTRENRYNSQPTRQPESSGDNAAASDSEDLGNSEQADSAYQMKNNSTGNENLNSELPGVNERQKQRRPKRKKSRSMISTDLPPLRDVGASANISSLGNNRRAILPPIQAPESKRSSVDIFTVTK